MTAIALPPEFGECGGTNNQCTRACACVLLLQAGYSMGSSSSLPRLLLSYTESQDTAYAWHLQLPFMRLLSVRTKNMGHLTRIISFLLSVIMLLQA